MSTPPLPSRERQRRWRDFWTLHIPLVLVLLLCASATWLQLMRALSGVDRSWVYTVQWPIIGAFAIAVWNHYRRHGSLTRFITTYYQQRVARFAAHGTEREPGAPPLADAAAVTSSADPSSVDRPPADSPSSDPLPADPQERAWREYLARLHAADPPGGPPPRSPGR
ncbi:MAG: hypothetical protein KGP10_09060 [Actinomycetales bacterium]|nr:hypothetical protein [Actinomycetales bacterium]